MGDFDKIAHEIADELSQLAREVDFNKLAHKIAPSLSGLTDFNELAHKIVEQVPDVTERVAEMSETAARTGARAARGGVAWLIPLATGAAVYAVAKNRSVIAQSLRQARERAPELPDVDVVGWTKADRGRADGELREHLRERAERRRRRRESRRDR